MLKIKYRFLFRTTLLALFFMFFFINNVFAAVDKIVFINEPQTVIVGESSERYQIQLQNSSDEIEIAPDTTYFTLPVDIGSFSSSKDGVPFTVSTSVYISTGSSNKYFYFKGSVVGGFTLRVSARNKNNTKQWETEQIVRVVDSIVPPIIDPLATTTATTTGLVSTSTATTTIVTRVVTHTVYVSTHSDSEDLSNYVKEESFQISAGRERIAYIGTPLNFKAENNKTDKKAYFTWSFGDITEGKGSEVSHVYKKAGEYIVVLNGKYNNEKAVSRINVKVLEPKIVLNIKEKDLEIENNGENEINIGGWKIKNIQTNFIIPKDTIIGSKNKIILPLTDILSMSLSGGLLIIEDQSSNIISFTQTSSDYLALIEGNKNEVVLKNSGEVEKILGIKVVDAEKIVLAHKTKTPSLSLKPKIDNLGEPNFSIVKSSNDDKTNNIEEIILVATVEESINSTSSISFWKKMIGLPVSGIKNVVGLFYEL